MSDESAADDGGIHRFWLFVLLRRAAGLEADPEDLFKLLILILLFEQAKDSLPGDHP